MTAETDHITRILTKSVLESLSPDEVILADQYSCDVPNKPITKGFLGGGLDLEIPMLLPFVWSFFGDLIDAVKHSATDAITAFVGDRFRGWLFDAGEKPVAINAEVQRELTQKIAAEFIKRGKSRTEAQTIADAVSTCLIKQAPLLKKIIVH